MPDRHGRDVLQEDLTIHARLGRYAAARPAQTIVVHQGRQTSRMGLERQACAIAARLAQAGLGVDPTVALCLPRGVDQIAAALAILKIGAACLPLSPDDPVETLRHQVADGDAALLLVAEDGDPRLAAAAGVAVMTIAAGRNFAGSAALASEAARGDAGRPMVGPLDPDRPDPDRLDGHGVAWVVPVAGVGSATCSIEITHANMLFLSAWLGGDYGLGPGDRVCHMADPAASTAMLEVWPSLAAGATIVIMDDADAMQPGAVTAWIEAERISALLAGEAAIEALAETPVRADAALRLVMTDLDHSPRYPIDPRFRLIATYGPEECGRICSARRVARNERPGGPHIGRPIPGAAIHILDGQGRKVSRGEEGEIWVAGPGVCRGYRNRPDLTAARFVPDPFGDDPAGMMFRTGRRGRTLISGVIGRSDDGAQAPRRRHGAPRVGSC